MRKLVAILIVAAFVPMAATNHAQAGSLTACENSKTHKVRFPAVGKPCKANESAIILAGPPGPPGPPGPSGGLNLELEGTGSLIPSAAACSMAGTCSGTLTATLDSQSLSLNLVINETPVSNAPAGSPPCFVGAGTGTLDTTAITFHGQLCVDGFQYILSGTISSDLGPSDICQPSPVMALEGGLSLFGAVSASGPTLLGGNPIPSGAGGAIVSIVGSMGQIPSPCPSP